MPEQNVEKVKNSPAGETKPQTEVKNQKSGDKVSTNDAKKSKRTCCCIACGGVLFLIFLILGVSLIYRSFFGPGSDIDLSKLQNTNNQTTTPATAPTGTTTTNYPSPEACSQVNTPMSTQPTVSTSDPGLKENVQNHTYQVYGYTTSDIMTQLNDCGPKYEGGSYHGITTYIYNWMWNLQPTANGCAISDAVVGVKVDIYLPSWETQGNVQTGLEEYWQTYIANLANHEDGHKQYALNGAAAILNALQNLTASTCDELNQTANDTANRIYIDYSNQSKAYDVETNHGQTQGASF